MIDEMQVKLPWELQPCREGAMHKGFSQILPNDSFIEDLLVEDQIETKRSEKLRAKNRRAQQRHRQKQKERQEELQKQAEELRKKLQQTLLHRDSLQNTTKQLEHALVDMRDSLDCNSTEQEAFFVPSRGAEGFMTKDGLSLEVLYSPPRRLTHEQILSLTVNDHMEIVKDLFEQIRFSMRSSPEPADTVEHKSLKAILNDYHGYLAWNLVKNPRLMPDLAAVNMQDGSKRNVEFWKTVLMEMDLSMEQKKYLLRLNAALLRDREKFLTVRGLLTQALEGLNTALKQGYVDMAISHLEWSNATTLLQENLEALQLLHSILLARIFTRNKGISVIQEGILLDKCYPFFPDIYFLMATLAATEVELAKEIFSPSGTPVLPVHAVPPASNIDANLLTKVAKEMCEDVITSFVTQYLPGYVEKL